MTYPSPSTDLSDKPAGGQPDAAASNGAGVKDARPVRLGQVPTGVVQFDSLELLQSIPSDSIDLIYTDPPFATGKVQRLHSIRASTLGSLVRTDFQGRASSYDTVSRHEYRDDMPFDEYLVWLEDNLREMHRVLKPTGSLYLHLDFHAVHYAKVILDSIFGSDHFLNEIIWSYDYGGRARDKWPRKHDNILWYAKGNSWTYNRDDIDRLPYMAPSLVTPEKAALGKLPTDVWFMTIVPTNSRDRTGWPTQKPMPLVERIVRASSNPGDLVVDFFGGSGTTAVAAQKLERKFLINDFDAEAIAITERRLERARRGLPFQDTRGEEVAE